MLFRIWRPNGGLQPRFMIPPAAIGCKPRLD
jgi:hypothetical protein